MKRFVPTCLLALAVLQGFIPADSCVMKLAGICRCDTGEPACCKHGKANCSECVDECEKPAQPANQHHTCCAYTPAHGLTVDAPNVPSVDVYQDIAPLAVSSILENLLAQLPTSTNASSAADSKQPPDTPLYLRARAILI